ncbi:MAG: Crp/Fnr family transcriptional regulator [Bacteroidetes bacterium]|nr:Crp/Fnr family transcriptional regulator [Bacteroidota bacterium]
MITAIPGKLNSCHDCKDISCAAAVLKISELELVNMNSLENEVKKGDIILHEGSMTSHIIYLKTGLVKEFIRQPNGREQILQIVKQHTYLGLPSLFSDRINHYSYAALENSHICYIDINVFNRLIRQNGEFAQQILISVCKDSLNNFNRFIKQSHKKIYGRVADAILYFSGIVFENDRFDLPFSQREFADLIGLSRESTTRVLIKFKNEGIISIKGKSITINNPDLLEQISLKG